MAQLIFTKAILFQMSVSYNSSLSQQLITSTSSMISIYSNKIPILWRVILVGGEILFPYSGQNFSFLMQKYFVHSQHFNITVSCHLNTVLHVHRRISFACTFFPDFCEKKVNSDTMNGNFPVAWCPFHPHIAA